MRGTDCRTGELFSYVDLAQRVPVTRPPAFPQDWGQVSTVSGLTEVNVALT